MGGFHSCPQCPERCPHYGTCDLRVHRLVQVLSAGEKDRQMDKCLHLRAPWPHILSPGTRSVESYVGNICVWSFIASHAELFFNKLFIFPRRFQCNQCLVAELTNPFSYSWTLGYRSFPSEGLERWLSWQTACCESLKTWMWSLEPTQKCACAHSIIPALE